MPLKAGLGGRRIHLRPFADPDADALFAAVESSRAALKRRLSWVSEVKNIEDERRYIEQAASAGKAGSAFVFGVFENRSKKLAGAASLTGMGDEARAQARIGFWIRAEKQDKGFASEAGKLLVAYGFRKAGLHRIYARLDPANRAFRRVLKKAGLRYEGCLRSDLRLNGRWVDQECWAILKTEWKP